MSFIDPLNDPRFPGRPSHPDFWSLSEILLGMDSEVEETGFEQMLTVVIDPGSITYMTSNRMATAVADIVLREGRITSEGVMTLMQAMWLEGFIAGNRYNAKINNQPNTKTKGETK